MAFTQSGYVVVPNYGDKRIVPLTVRGVPIAPGVLAGDVHTVLGWVAERFDDTVDVLQAGQCWGFAPRQIRGGSGYSNHASGTAIDLNSARFPQGSRNMTTKQIAACRAIVTESAGVIRWGGDFGGSTAVDQMHFEIAPGKSGAPVAKLAATIREGDDIMPVIKTLKQFRAQTRKALVNKNGKLRPEVRAAVAAVVAEELAKQSAAAKMGAKK